MSLPDGNADADDSQLIAAISDGDVNAYSTLVLRYQGAIFNLMFRMTGSYEDATDLAQETFIKAYDQLYRFQRGQEVFPLALYDWFESCAKFFAPQQKNTHGFSGGLRDRLRAGLSGPAGGQHLRKARLWADPCGDSISFRSITGRRLYCATMRGCPWKNVAEAMNLKLSAAKMRVHRGLAKLRDILGNNQNGKERT